MGQREQFSRVVKLSAVPCAKCGRRDRDMRGRLCDLCGVGKYNPNHQPAGDSKGGQFAPKGTSGTSSAAEAVAHVEAHIWDKPTEHAYAFDKKGNALVDKSGSASAVEFTTEEANLMRNSVFTHNHPAGNSFSSDDIEFAITNNVAEMRATGKHGTFVVKRPYGGWGGEDNDSPLHDIWQEVKAELRYAEKQTMEDGNASLRGVQGVHEWQAKRTQLETFHWHNVWERVFEATGYEYSFIPRGT